MNSFVKSLLPGLLLPGMLLISACGDNPPPKPAKEPEKKAAPAEKKTPPVRKTFADEEEGSLKVRYRNPDAGKGEPEVRSGQKNLTVLDRDDPAAAVRQEKVSKKEKALRDSFRTKRPENSFAAKLAPLNSGKIIRWSPEWRSDTLKGVRLPATAFSPDRSIIVIAETLGENQGPFGTRLVFLDTHSWTVTAVHHLLKKDVRSIAVSPGHLPVLAARGQNAFKNADEIIVLDPWTGAEKCSVPLPGVRRVFINPAGRVFAVFRPDSETADRVLVFDSLLKDGDPTSKEIKSANRSPVIAFSDDGSRICLAGDRAVELVKDSDLHIMESFPLPEGFVTADLLVMPDDTVIAAPESSLMRPAVAVRGGTVRPFGENSSGMLLALPDSQGKRFGEVMNRLGRISTVALSTLTEQTGVDPEEARPRTTGKPMAVFAFAKIRAMAVLDEKGCFYLLYLDPAGKRWHKEILFKSAFAQ